MKSIYTNGNVHGNGHGGNRSGYYYCPLPISGHAIAALTNGDADVQGVVGAMLLPEEAQLIGPISVPQAATLTVSTLQRIYEALHLTPKARRLFVQSKLGLVVKTNGGMSPGEMNAFVRPNLLQVWDSIERITA